MVDHDDVHGIPEPSAEASDEDALAARLSAYIDDDLEPAERADTEALLGRSAGARAMLAQLHAVRDAAPMLRGALPAWDAVAAVSDASLERDLWPGIAARTTRARRPMALSLPAAAALLFAAVGLTWWLSHSAPAQSAPQGSHAPQGAQRTRYVLLLHETPSDGPQPPPDVLRPIIARYAAWRRERAVLGEKLADDGGLLLRGDDAQPLRPAGDMIGGLFVIEAADDAEARAIAATCPHLQFGGSIELRRIEDT